MCEFIVYLCVKFQSITNLFFEIYILKHFFSILQETFLKNIYKKITQNTFSTRFLITRNYFHPCNTYKQFKVHDYEIIQTYNYFKNLYDLYIIVENNLNI